jgi:hypothetical protein
MQTIWVLPMMSSQMLCMIVLSILIGTGGCALNPLEIEPFREVSCFEAAKVSLHDAVEVAQIEGGMAIDAAYRQTQEMGCLEGNAGYYHVTIPLGEKLVPVSVDARSQQIQPRMEQGVVRDVMGNILNP